MSGSSAPAPGLPADSLFRAALADRWHDVPPEVQALHSGPDVARFAGRARIDRGTSLVARLAAWFFGFPPTHDDVAVTVTISRTASGETWVRDFDGRVLRSNCAAAPAPYRYRERFGIFNFEQDLLVADGAVRFVVRRGWLLGIPMPAALLPRSDTREYAADGLFHFDVDLAAPLNGGRLVRYRGSLAPLCDTENAP